MPVSSDAGDVPRASSSSEASARSVATWPASSSTGRILIVDVGLSFPHAEMPGIDLVLPDFEYVRERIDDVEAVVLTHGHEDHIGALPYLLREFDGESLPVYGTAFTLALLEGKLEEHQVARPRRVPDRSTPGEAATIGPFSMRFLRVTHSIPDGMAVVDRHAATARSCTRATSRSTRRRSTGAPPTCTRSPRRRAAACTCCCRDSTNAEEAGYTDERAERRPGPAGHRRAGAAARRGRVLLEPHPPDPAGRERRPGRRARRRVPRPLDAPERRGRARRLGLLHVARARRDPDRGGRATSIPRASSSICTGVAGRAVLGALADGRARAQVGEARRGRHASCSRRSLIPGNEPAIHRVVDGLYRTGADVFHLPAYPVHASGHAAAEELRLMLSLVRPRWFIPIHGERRHLAHHAKIATEVGIPRRPRPDLRGRRRGRGGGEGRDRRAGPGRHDLRRRPRHRRRRRGGAARPPQALGRRWSWSSWSRSTRTTGSSSPARTS